MQATFLYNTFLFIVPLQEVEMLIELTCYENVT